MKLHNPRVGFASHTFTFNSEYCRKHCNTPARLTKINALHNLPLKSRPIDLLNRLKLLKDKDIARVSLSACAAYARRDYRMFTVTVEQID